MQVSGARGFGSLGSVQFKFDWLRFSFYGSKAIRTLSFYGFGLIEGVEFRDSCLAFRALGGVLLLGCLLFRLGFGALLGLPCKSLP